MRFAGCTLVLLMVVTACAQSSQSDQPIFHDPHETRIAGWTGVDARSLVPSNYLGSIGLLTDSGQSSFTSDGWDLAFPPTGEDGSLLTAHVGPGAYFVLVDACSPDSLPGPGKLYEAEVVSGSHAVPTTPRAVQYNDDSAGGLGCTGSPGTGPAVTPTDSSSLGR